MTCKDCLHYEACKSLLESQGYVVDGDGVDADKRCDTFAEKTLYVKLHCAVGSEVYEIYNFLSREEAEAALKERKVCKTITRLERKSYSF